MEYNNKTKQELIKLILEKDSIISRLSKRKEPGRPKFKDESTIRLMYDMFLSNTSLQGIANFLNSNNIKSPAGGLWGKSSINLILKDQENIKKYLDDETYKNFIARKERGKK